MSAFQVSNHTIDLITQAAYKYKMISKPSRTLFGRTLIEANDAAMSARYPQHTPMTREAIAEYTFTPLARKFKRNAVTRAVACLDYQCNEDPTWTTSEARRLVMRMAEKNAASAGIGAEWTEPEYDEGDPFFDEDERTLVRSAFTIHNATLSTQVDPEVTWWDITASEIDPDSDDYANSVMVRPIEVIQAERVAERERVFAERAAAQATRDAEAQAARTADESYTDDEDEDEDDDEYDGDDDDE